MPAALKPTGGDRCGEDADNAPTTCGEPKATADRLRTTVTVVVGATGVVPPLLLVALRPVCATSDASVENRRSTGDACGAAGDTEPDWCPGSIS